MLTEALHAQLSAQQKAHTTAMAGFLARFGQLACSGGRGQCSRAVLRQLLCCWTLTSCFCLCGKERRPMLFSHRDASLRIEPESSTMQSLLVYACLLLQLADTSNGAIEHAQGLFQVKPTSRQERVLLMTEAAKEQQNRTEAHKHRAQGVKPMLSQGPVDHIPASCQQPSSACQAPCAGWQRSGALLLRCPASPAAWRMLTRPSSVRQTPSPA